MVFKDRSEIHSTIKPDTSIFREVEKVAGGQDFVAISGTIYAVEADKKDYLQRASYSPGQYCVDSKGTKIEEVFVTQISYLVKLR